MFFPEGVIRVHLFATPVDMRNSFDGLSALVKHATGLDPLSGRLFVFINRRATQMVLRSQRFLCLDQAAGGGSLCQRLAPGSAREMDWTQLKLMLEGIEPGRQRKRYKQPKNAE